MQRLICAALLLASAGAVARAGESSSTRFWTDNTGEFTVKAKVDRVDRQVVTLKLEHGDRIRVPLRRLSSDDQAWLKQQNLMVEVQSETISGINWFADFEDAKMVAVEDDKPIMCFRALGDLSGFMWSAGHAMRTVSFSRRDVQDALNTDFVCHMINTEGDASAGGSQAHAPQDKPGPCAEGVANQNVQVLFLTPGGEIFHTVSGYRGPSSLKQELAFSKTLFTKIQASPDSAKEIVRTVHRERQPNLTGSRRSAPRRRQSGGGGGGSIRRSLQLDYTFADKYPMLPLADLQERPRLLVGTGTSRFTSGTSLGGKIGR